MALQDSIQTKQNKDRIIDYEKNERNFMPNPYVVVVDDCPDESFLFTRIIEQHEQDVDFRLLQDGAQAIDFLKNPDNKTPDLIILDNKLPLVSGIEVIKALMQHERYQSVPIILVSAAFSKGAIKEAYRAGARSCIRKDDDVPNWNRKLRSVFAYWLTINEV
jgi:CheY-like chemotaxis protein